MILWVTSEKGSDPNSRNGPKGALHYWGLTHPPWCNYGTNKFCGDTFDLVNRWPESRLAKYCHYWNGRFLQHNKEYEQAIESFELVLKQGPRFALSDDADYGIVECLAALGKSDEAEKHNAALLKKYQRQTGPTAVLRLAQRHTTALE